MKINNLFNNLAVIVCLSLVGSSTFANGGNSNNTPKYLLNGPNQSELALNTAPDKEPAKKVVNNPRYKQPETNKTKPAYILPSEDNKPVVDKPVADKKPTTPKPTESVKQITLPDEQTLTNNFINTRGALSWPTNGLVIAPFGKYNHPTEAKVMIENKGVDIAAKAGSPVNSVFQGRVSKVLKISGTYTVIMNHGDYYTVYGNLSSVIVKEGDQIDVKQKIGVVGRNELGTDIVHFEICKKAGKTVSNEDPSSWLILK